MATSDKRHTGPFNSVIKIAAEMLKDHNRKRQLVGVTPEPIEPVDCDALLDLIQAAQAVYTENCPIAQPENPPE